MIRLTDEQWERIRDHFPEENIADGRPGRKPTPTRCVLEAVLWILNTAKGGGLEIGATKRGKGMKIMAIVDRHGLPLSVSAHAANHHEVRLVQLCFDFYMIEAKPENLIGDRAYDSDPWMRSCERTALR